MSVAEVSIKFHIHLKKKQSCISYFLRASTVLLYLNSDHYCLETLTYYLFSGAK